jgi:hypothetical protein
MSEALAVFKSRSKRMTAPMPIASTHSVDIALFGRILS